MRPNRNTIAREFGSWHRALEAAGLADRAAASPATVAARHNGGTEARAKRRDVKRQRVISAVLRFAREHGRPPRAIEFFRWQLDSAADAPCQRTVYSLFPGGWADVLERARQAAGATV
jgi:Homing endonuclease associated repeat